jgi:hypothetical protein
MFRPLNTGNFITTTQQRWAMTRSQNVVSSTVRRTTNSAVYPAEKTLLFLGAMRHSMRTRAGARASSAQTSSITGAVSKTTNRRHFAWPEALTGPACARGFLTNALSHSVSGQFAALARSALVLPIANARRLRSYLVVATSTVVRTMILRT